MAETLDGILDLSHRLSSEFLWTGKIESILWNGAFGSIVKLSDEIANQIEPTFLPKVVKVMIKLGHNKENPKMGTNLDDFKSEVSALKILSNRDTQEPRILNKDYDFSPMYCGWAEDSDHYFIVMEFIPGETLCNYITSSDPLTLSIKEFNRLSCGEGTTKLSDCIKDRFSLDQICYNLGIRMLSIVKTIYSLGIVHRDIKPENIIVQEKPDSSIRVIFLDWGASCSKAFEGMRKCNVKIGTYFYMSPELVRDNLSFPLASDYWSVGASLYFCITGEVIFSSEGFNLAAKSEYLQTIINYSDTDMSISDFPLTSQILNATLVRDQISRRSQVSRK